MQIKIQGDAVDLKKPESISARWDVYSAATANANRAFAAALALCWDGPNPPRARLSAHRFDALAYGGAVIDELVDRGASVAEVVGAGLRAWQLCGEGLITSQEVEEVEGFSNGGEG